VNTREIVRKLRAFDTGRPLPSAETLHFQIADENDTLVVAFLRMGGESRPWGVAYGPPDAAPTILTVPDGRRRDDVAQMIGPFADTILEHLRCPGWSIDEPGGTPDLAPLRQVWLPNPSHLEMFDHLAHAYTFTKWGAELQPKLNAFGRACGWLFREAQRPGQQHVRVATDALRSAYTFPAEDTRQGHLGYLLAWLTTNGDRDKRLQAASQAERSSIATNLDPDVERSIEDTVDSWGKADRAGKKAFATKSAKAVRSALAPELKRRVDLTVAALELLRGDSRRVNAGVQELVEAALDEQWYQHTRIELKLGSADDGPWFVPSVETDRHPAAAASRYLVHEASKALFESVLVHDDAELLAEVIASGDGFRGKVVRVANEGEGAKKVPVWWVETPFPIVTRLRPGSGVCVVGLPRRTATVRSLETTVTGGYCFELEITNLKKEIKAGIGRDSIPPVDKQWIGEEIAFVSASGDGISRAKSFAVWKAKEGPGAWLTHSRPAGPRAVIPEEDVDDVGEVEATL
jgi:hypothetical protein